MRTNGAAFSNDTKSSNRELPIQFREETHYSDSARYMADADRFKPMASQLALNG
jgi:hypothetical protein